MSKMTFKEARDQIAQKYLGTYAKWDEIDWYALNYSFREDPIYINSNGMEEVMTEEAAELMAKSWANESVKEDRDSAIKKMLSTPSILINSAVSMRPLPYEI